LFWARHRRPARPQALYYIQCEKCGLDVVAVGCEHFGRFVCGEKHNPEMGAGS